MQSDNTKNSSLVAFPVHRKPAYGSNEQSAFALSFNSGQERYATGETSNDKPVAANSTNSSHFPL
jgi:hypothetical protein